MSALERAKEDLKRGDHWLARQRLESYLQTTGYDPDVFAEAGRIAAEMHDEYNAGRLWLTSTASGPNVDQAIAVFMRCAKQKPTQIAAQLPSSARLASRDQYPAMVRTRLESLGICEAIVAAARRARVEEQSALGKTFWSVLLTVIGLSLFIVSITAFVLGLNEMLGWLTG